MNTQAIYCDYPTSALGTLSPPDFEEHHQPHAARGEIMVNGVALPLKVVEELRRLGMSLSWYSAGELEDAVQACKINSNLVDDPNGVNFRDKLVHSDAEKAADMHGQPHARFRVRRPQHIMHPPCEEESAERKSSPAWLEEKSCMLGYA